VSVRACVCASAGEEDEAEESSVPQDPLTEVFNPKVWGTPIRGLAAMDYLAPAFITYPAPKSIIVGVKQIGRMLRHKHFASMINRLDKEQRTVCLAILRSQLTSLHSLPVSMTFSACGCVVPLCTNERVTRVTSSSDGRLRSISMILLIVPNLNLSL
jgi:hypothetical protein